MPAGHQGPAGRAGVGRTGGGGGAGGNGRTIVKLGIMLVVFALVNIAPWIELRHRNHPHAPAAHKPKKTPAASTPKPAAKKAPRVVANRGNALLDGYDAHRSDRACEPLPSNVTMDLEQNFELGMASEVMMPDAIRKVWVKQGGSPKILRSAAQTKKGGRGYEEPTPAPPLPVDGDANETAAANSSAVDESKPTAYVLMVSNHKYVDGALVMGSSLRATSKKVKSGECELVILVSENMHDDSLRLLATVFDRVKVMRTVGRFAKKSAYTNTFDKMYLWFMLEYRLVMFLDADHLVYKAEGIEKLWTRHELDKPNQLMAVGDGGYFQTALMVVPPNRDIFIDIYLEFRYGSFGYNQWRARDGILLRNCFLKSVRGIGHPNGLFHFYGFTKPWMNNKKKPRGPNYALTFDSNYRTWWKYYEKLHEQFFLTFKSTGGSGKEGYAGGKVTRDEDTKYWIKKIAHGAVKPADFMWIQRYSGGSEYLRPTKKVRKMMAHKTVPSLEVYVSHRSGASCDAVCADAGGDSSLVCRDDALLWAAVNDGDVLRNYTIAAATSGESAKTKVAACDTVDTIAYTPYMTTAGKGAKCFRGAGDDVFHAPACNATCAGECHRVCPCVKPDDRKVAPTREWKAVSSSSSHRD